MLQEDYGKIYFYDGDILAITDILGSSLGKDYDAIRSNYLILLKTRGDNLEVVNPETKTKVKVEKSELQSKIQKIFSVLALWKDTKQSSDAGMLTRIDKLFEETKKELQKLHTYTMKMLRSLGPKLFVFLANGPNNFTFKSLTRIYKKEITMVLVWMVWRQNKNQLQLKDQLPFLHPKHKGPY